MAHVYSDMSLFALYDQPKVAELDGVLILNDNFDSSIHLDPEINAVFRGNPNKLVSTTIILLCVEGTIDLANNMKDYRLKKNDVIINRSGTMGDFYGMSDDAKFILIAASSNFYYPLLTSGDSSELQNITVTHPVCHLPESVAKNVLRLYNVLKEQLNTSDDIIYIGEVAKGVLQALHFNVLSVLVQEAREERRQHRKVSRGQDIYDRFMQAVEVNYMRERDIQFYADKLCLTPKYLSQVIYKESGSYAGEHIKRFVIMEAKALIRSKRYTVSQICDILNFSSQSFFTKYFRNATGMSPTEYQNQ